ncbi:hypothetical protein CU633_18800 [Bacillus sp. V3-13]|uniref:hypothetical protein n=1 Tax=Bacillus sp. V3-13 TaxID=2053728 RepID=UPI000C75F86C|nr:hypothetical protein [Bacillus sp. V3-13]PLR75820.1 hypothetical protein CU633_18800 [Bacillus sp. V3-13]
MNIQKIEDLLTESVIDPDGKHTVNFNGHDQNRVFSSEKEADHFIKKIAIAQSLNFEQFYQKNKIQLLF